MAAQGFDYSGIGRNSRAAAARWPACPPTGPAMRHNPHQRILRHRRQRLGSHLCERHCSPTVTGALRRQASSLAPGWLVSAPAGTTRASRLMRHDVTFPLYVEVDRITASPARPAPSTWHDPVRTTKTSVHGAINMLGLAKLAAREIFQASTSEGLWRPRRAPAGRGYWGSDQPHIHGLRSCRRGKRCAGIFFDYHRQHGLQIKVARIFNRLRSAHAPQRRPRVVSSFIDAGARDGDITICSEASRTHGFCFVSDLSIEGHRAPDGFAPEVTGPISLGNPEPDSPSANSPGGTRTHRQPLASGVPAAAARRAHPASARHPPQRRKARLGAHRAAARACYTIGYRFDRLLQRLARVPEAGRPGVNVTTRCPGF